MADQRPPFKATLTTVMPFGKYKRQTCEEIAARDPGYITEFMASNPSGFEISEQLMALADGVEERDLYDEGDWHGLSEADIMGDH